MHPIKLIIKKRRPFGVDWVRFWEVERILLAHQYIFKSEAQFANYIHKRHGVGRYQVLAWQKGYEGFWMFWLGDIFDDGFVRDKKKNKELDKLKTEFNKTADFEEKRDIEEEINFSKEMYELSKGGTRKGPMWMKTVRPGQYHHFEELP